MQVGHCVGRGSQFLLSKGYENPCAVTFRKVVNEQCLQRFSGKLRELELEAKVYTSD